MADPLSLTATAVFATAATIAADSVIRTLKRSFGQQERGVFIVTRLVDMSESRSKIVSGDGEQLPMQRLSVESFEKMAQNTRRRMTASRHWGVLVARDDNIFEGTVFELLREHEHSKPKKSKGTILRETIGGKPRWIYESFQARTYLKDDEIMSHGTSELFLPWQLKLIPS